MSELRVLVVGASVAGPATAYWLAKAGARVTVIERFSKLRLNGQNIDIRSVGVEVMRKMAGMEAAVRAKTAQLEGISFVRSDGRSYGVLRPTGNPDQQSLVSEYEIFRGDLAQILYDMTKTDDHVRYVFGEQVTSIQQHEKADGPVTVEFANGFPTAEYDLVVACDGATSRTRAIGLGCGVRDHIKPTGLWAAYCSTDQDVVKGNKVGQGFSAPGGRCISAWADPSGVNRILMMGSTPKADSEVLLQYRTALKQGDEALKQFMIQHYEGAGWKTDEILESVRTSSDFYGSELVQVKPPSLSRGRFVLVGDAGYAPGPTGGGTSLALAGAYVLAGELGRHKSDIVAGLRGYEEQMRPLITELQKIPPFIPSILAPQTAWGIWLRNNIFGFIVWTGIIDFAGKYFANAFASSAKDRLPRYDWVR